MTKVDVSVKIHEKISVCKEDYVWNARVYAWEINRYLKSIVDDLVMKL